MDMQRGQSDLFLVDVRDGRTHRLTQDASNEASPFFDRDGRSVLAASDRDGAWRLWRFPLDSDAAPQRVGAIDVRFGTRDPSGEGYVVSSPDSAGVWQVSASGDIRKFLPLPLYGAEDGGNWTVFEDGILFIHRAPDGASSVGVYDFASGRITFQPADGIVKRNSGLTLSTGASVVLYTIENRRESDLVVADLRDF
jgi:Tol biopolymer transport system component